MSYRIREKRPTKTKTTCCCLLKFIFFHPPKFYKTLLNKNHKTIKEKEKKQQINKQERQLCLHFTQKYRQFEDMGLYER